MDAHALDEMYRLESRHWWFVGKRLLVDALLDGVLPGAAPRLLDVGCGTGGVLSHLDGRAHTVGVDGSARALGYCRERGLVRLVCAEGGRLPFAHASFDIVLLLDALEHFADEGPALADIRALLTPRGRLLVSVPAFQFLWSAHDDALGHVRRYTARTLRQALERSHFVVHRITYTNVIAFPPAVLVRGVLRRLQRAAPPRTDLGMSGRGVNGALIAAYRLEAWALRHVRRLPCGLSVAALAGVDGA